MEFLEILFTVIGIALIITIGVAPFLLWNRSGKNKDEDMVMPDDTRQIPEVSEDFEVPAEDQEYLLPITVATLKKLAFSKRMAPTNAMLIEHLAEALSEAAQDFTPRKNNSEPVEKKNETWLWVAAFAIRLYDEGTPHNSRETREAFVTEGTLASRRLKQWATKVNNDIAQMVKEGTVGKKNVQNVTEHARTVTGTPYTPDEVEDMKAGARESFMEIVKKNNK